MGTNQSHLLKGKILQQPASYTLLQIMSKGQSGKMGDCETEQNFMQQRSEQKVITEHTPHQNMGVTDHRGEQNFPEQPIYQIQIMSTSESGKMRDGETEQNFMQQRSEQEVTTEHTPQQNMGVTDHGPEQNFPEQPIYEIQIMPTGESGKMEDCETEQNFMQQTSEQKVTTEHTPQQNMGVTDHGAEQNFPEQPAGYTLCQIMSTGESGKMEDCETEQNFMQQTSEQKVTTEHTPEQNMVVTDHGAEQNFPEQKIYQIQIMPTGESGKMGDGETEQNFMQQRSEQEVTTEHTPEQNMGVTDHGAEQNFPEQPIYQIQIMSTGESGKMGDGETEQNFMQQRSEQKVTTEHTPEQNMGVTNHEVEQNFPEQPAGYTLCQIMSTGESGKMEDCETEQNFMQQTSEQKVTTEHTPEQNMGVTDHGAEQNFPEQKIYQIQIMPTGESGKMGDGETEQNFMQQRSEQEVTTEHTPEQNMGVTDHGAEQNFPEQPIYQIQIMSTGESGKMGDGETEQNFMQQRSEQKVTTEHTPEQNMGVTNHEVEQNFPEQPAGYTLLQIMSTGESGNIEDCETEKNFMQQRSEHKVTTEHTPEQNMGVTGYGAEQNFPEQPIYQIQTTEHVHRVASSIAEYQALQNGITGHTTEGNSDARFEDNGTPVLDESIIVHYGNLAAIEIPIVPNSDTVHNGATAANGIPIDQNAAAVHNGATAANGIPIDQNAAAVHNGTTAANGIPIVPNSTTVHDAASVQQSLFIHPATARALMPVQGGTSVSALMHQLNSGPGNYSYRPGLQGRSVPRQNVPVVNPRHYFESFGKPAPGHGYTAPPANHQQHIQYGVPANRHPPNVPVANQQQYIPGYAAPGHAPDNTPAANQQQGDAEPAPEHIQVHLEDSASLAVPSASLAVPSNERYPGDYGFTADHSKLATWTKNKDALYKREDDQIYTNRNKWIPIEFRTKIAPPLQSRIRVTVVFSEPNHINKPVKICQNHLKGEKDDSKKHLLLCQNNDVDYDINETTEQESLLIPYQQPRKGSDGVRNLFLFQCYSTCHGVERRMLQIIYTLEHEEKVLGRDVVKVKISARPHRDANKGKRNTQRGNAPGENAQPPVKRHKKASSNKKGKANERQVEDDDDNRLYWVWTETKDVYKELIVWRDRLEHASMADPQTREQIERQMAEMDAKSTPQVKERDEHEKA